MRIQEWDELHDIVVDATRELFDVLNLHVEYAGSIPYRGVAWSEVIAVMGYGGHLRGSLVLSVPPGLALQSHPTKSAILDDLNDWRAELSNLVLGRIKARLLTRGIVIELSTPLAISATKVRFERFLGTPVVHTFCRDDERMYVMVEAVADRATSLAPPRPDSVVGVGEMISFD